MLRLIKMEPQPVGSAETQTTEYAEISSNPLNAYATPPTLPPKPHRRSILPLIILLVIGFFTFLIASSGAIVIAAAYYPQTFSFVPSNVRFATNAFLATLPVPKNVDQVFMNLTRAKSPIEKYHQKYFAEFKTNGAAIVGGSGMLAIRADGPVILNAADPDFEQTINVVASTDPNIMYQFNANITKAQNNLYFKINSVPVELVELFVSLIGLDSNSFAEQITGKWFVLDTDMDLTGREYTVTPPSANTDEFTKYREFGEKMLTDFSDFDYHNYIDFSGPKLLEGREAYQISVDKTGAELRPVVEKFLRFVNNNYDYIDPNRTPIETNQFEAEIADALEGLKYVDFLKIDVWVDVETSRLLRFTMESSVTTPSSELPDLLQPSTDCTNLECYNSSPVLPGQDLNITLNMGWEATQVNDPAILVTAPIGATPIIEFLQSMVPAYPEYPYEDTFPDPYEDYYYDDTDLYNPDDSEFFNDIYDIEDIQGFRDINWLNLLKTLFTK